MIVNSQRKGKNKMEGTSTTQTSGGTLYDVFIERTDAETTGKVYEPVGKSISAVSDVKAIETVLEAKGDDAESGTYVAVAIRHFRPRAVKLQKKLDISVA